MATNVAAKDSLRLSNSRFTFRKAVDRAAVGFMLVCTVITVSLLFLILAYVIYKGVSALSFDFLISLPAPAGEPGGGIANALVGTMLITLVASLIAIPIGIGAAIFLNEFPQRRLAGFVRFLADVMTGVPSIVVGLFVYALVVQPTKTFSGYAGSLAYAFIMLPIILISAQEALRLVPVNIREASLALGVPRWRTILRVVLPTSSRALLTGLVLAIARAMGETAPMIFTSFGNAFWNVDMSKAMATVPYLIYRYAVGPYDDWHRQAWAASFVLVVVVLLASMLTRFALRSRFDD